MPIEGELAHIILRPIVIQDQVPIPEVVFAPKTHLKIAPISVNLMSYFTRVFLPVTVFSQKHIVPLDMARAESSDAGIRIGSTPGIN
jgi:hypothetical protein